VTLCKPAGALRLLTFPPPRKVLQLPGVVVILSERDVTYRQIFTDGRPLPTDPSPSFNGYSTGRLLEYYCNDNEKDRAHLIRK
jgi:hypothetical protein